MKLSVVIPAYNEEKTIGEVLEAVYRLELPALVKEIIVVDDGSKDNTPLILEGWRDRCIVLRHEKNMGKGACIKSALAKASGDIIAIQDADLEYDPAQFEKLIPPILSEEADVVYGSRFLPTNAPRRVFLFWHYLGNRVITFVFNLFSNLNLTDVETGMKVFRTQALKGLDIRENDFGFEIEVTIKLAKKNRLFYEVGIPYFARGYSQGKKTRWYDAIKAVWLIMKYSLSCNCHA